MPIPKPLQEMLEQYAGEMGGRLMVLDDGGKVQFDSFSELNGKRMELPEVASILLGERVVDYGVHGFDPNRGVTVFSYLSAQDGLEDDWVSYCAAALSDQGQIVGVLLFSSSVGDLMESLLALQKNMIIYFLIAAGVAMIIALILSRFITRPLDRLTRGIQRMGRGDLSVRVPVKGGGELRKLAETFNTMSEKLERLDKSRNQFVSNASHELKTPLSTMKILLENIIYQPDMNNNLRTEFLTDVNSEIDRLNLIISDLLTLVSMDTKAMRLRLETFKLADVCREVVQRLSIVAQQKHQEIKVSLSDGCEMHADHAKLTQAVYNILDNAIKYTPPGGVIRMRLIRSGRNAVLTIADNGPGIPKEDQAHIFDRFYRVDKARSRDTGGTGLGLSIVHQFVLMHGGNVSVDSTEGSGTTFTIELPMGGHLAGLGGRTMSKRYIRAWLLAAVILLPLLLGGCYEQLNPLSKNEATPAPGLSEEVFAAVADENNAGQIRATLYFRYLDEPMLAGECRALSVRADRRPEQAIIDALLEGPSAGNADMRRLLPAEAQVISVTSRGQVLFVTFNEAFLNDGIPENWAETDAWRTEAPLRRKLILQSIVASITENYPYTGVQFLVYRENETQTSLRLDNEYYLDGSVGLSEPIVRDDALLLTPHSTAKTMLNAWAQKDYERMYKYLSKQGRPVYSAFVEALDAAPSADVFSIGASSVYDDGQTGAVTVFLRLISGGEETQVLGYPLLLVRENCVWKIAYQRLAALMLGQ